MYLIVILFQENNPHVVVYKQKIERDVVSISTRTMKSGGPVGLTVTTRDKTIMM